MELTPEAASAAAKAYREWEDETDYDYLSGSDASDLDVAKLIAAIHAAMVKTCREPRDGR